MRSCSKTCPLIPVVVALVAGLALGIVLNWDKIGTHLPLPIAGTQKTFAPYEPQSETGAFLMAQRAEDVSDWPATHRALQFLEKTTDLPDVQNARLFLASIASGDWDTAHKTMLDHPAAVKESAPLVKMLAALLEWSDGKDADAKVLLETTTPNVIIQPVLPFVRGWMTRETPRLGLMEAAQDIGFSTINMVRFYEATKQYNKADALMTKLQEADLSLRLSAWSIAYFERRGLAAQVDIAKAKLAKRTEDLPPTLWQQEKDRVLPEAAGHLKNDKRAAALMLLDATDFLEAHNASAIALLYAQMAHKLAPDLGGASLVLASIYENQQNWDEALALYRTMKSQDPGYLIAQVRIAAVLAEAERNDEARKAYRHLTSLFPENPEVWYQAAEFYRVNVQDYAAAIPAYTRASELFGKKVPDAYWTIYLARGLCYDMTDQPEKAMDDYEAALKLQPENPEALNTLAYSWAEKGQKLDEAEAMLNRALRAEPDAPHIIDSLGWVLFKKGQPEKAVLFIERAAQMMPYDTTVNGHLGDIYAAMGRKREAEFMWTRALDNAENDKQRRELKGKLKVQ